MGKFFITSDGRDWLGYEDDSCKVKISVADFRDPALLVVICSVVDKNKNQKCKLATKQMQILYQRIANRVKATLATDEVGFIGPNDAGMSEDMPDILEIE